MKDILKAYNHQDYENKIYEAWEKGNFFAPKEGKGKPFCVIMPPPNSNGSLHLGHAVFVTLEDIMIRYHRLKGRTNAVAPGRGSRRF